MFGAHGGAFGDLFFYFKEFYKLGFPKEGEESSMASQQLPSVVNVNTRIKTKFAWW